MNTTLFINANTYTFDIKIPRAWGFRINEGKVTDLYPEPVQPGRADNVVDLQGATVLPSFTDSHLHLLSLSETFASADLTESKSESDAVAILKKWVEGRGVPPDAWIQGFGWSFNDWTPPRLPSRNSLDREFPRNPVMLLSKCCHLMWVNSRALEVSGLNSASRQELEKWGEQIAYFPDGSLSGIIKEDAEYLVLDVIPTLSLEQKLALFDQTVDMLNRFGIFCVHDLDGFDSLELLLEALRYTPDLPLRAVRFLPTEDIDRIEKTAKEINPDPALNSRISIEGIKLFVDGSLGGRTAWMFDPFEGEPNNYGIAVAEFDRYVNLVYEANRRGLRASVHAIGDRAVSFILEVFRKVQEKLGADGLRPIKNRIEHYQLLNHDIIEATSKLQPVISMQPKHLAGDWRAVDDLWGERGRFAYAFASVLKTGSPMIFGSDAPVESPEPWKAIFAAVNRQDTNYEPPGGWYPEEKISLQHALHSYISEASKVSEFDRTGALKPDNLADFILLSHDPFTIPTEKIDAIKAIAGFFNGSKVFGDI